MPPDSPVIFSQGTAALDCMSGVPNEGRCCQQLDDSEGELVHRFAERLAALAQRHISQRLRHKVEPEDITQSVFRTFFRRRRKGEFEVHDWNRVWGLLVRLAICKCRNRAIYLQAQRRDVRKEFSLDSQEEHDSTGQFQLQGTRTYPDEEAAAAEVLETFFEKLDADDQTILAKHLAGCCSPTISVQVGCSEQTVRRRMQQMERQLRIRLAAIGSPAVEVVTN